MFVDIVEKMQKDVQLRTTVFASGSFQFYGLTVTQDDDHTVNVHGDDAAYRAVPLYSGHRQDR